MLKLNDELEEAQKDLNSVGALIQSYVSAGQHPKGRFRQIVEQKILKRKGRTVVQPDQSQIGSKSKARRRLAFKESEDDDEDDGERTARATAMTTVIGEQNRVENRNGPRRLQRAGSNASMQM